LEDEISRKEREAQAEKKKELMDKINEYLKSIKESNENLREMLDKLPN